MGSHTAHSQDTMSPEQGFVGYSYPSRYSTPVREDDSSAYEPSTVYSQRSDVSFTGYTGSLGITSHPYGPLPDEVGYNTHLPYTPEASPPEPCSTSDSITTRSGLNIAKKPFTAKSPVVKAGRVQKRSRAEKAKNASNMLSKPLSETAKDLPDIPVADIATFVNRSTEARLSETSRNKKVGQIKRPMNAFMLYRKAYQDVAKTQCSQNNHQHVSKVCGAAWLLEPAHIKDTFDQWARIERMNHQKAHPGYKFMPSKPRKTRRDEDGDDDYTENDSDWNGGRGASAAARKSRFRQVARPSETSSINYDAVGHPMSESSMATYHDMYAYPPPGRSHTFPYGQFEPSSYELSIRQYNGLGISHEMVSRTRSPGSFDCGVHGLDGFPSNYYAPPEPAFDTAVPPMFGAAPYEIYDGLPAEIAFGQEGWFPMGGSQDMIPMMGGHEDTTAQEAYLKGNKEDWKVEVMDEPGHFEDWYAQTEHGLQ
ncbi:hypothetical protein F66182_7277 [Fusarium sp. NRRL 66182]|nr:hypothetical protein F66182_7277 [Fusarium sp. NRRL 66182]